MHILHADTGNELRGGQRQVLLLLHGLRQAGVRNTLLAASASPLFKAASAAGFEVHSIGLKAVRDHSKMADLVHAHDAHSHTSCAIAARVPFVVSRRVAFAVKQSLLSEWKYRQASRFLAVSKFVANGLARTGIPEDKIDVVYDGVAPGFASAVRSAEAPVVALASHDPAKGRDLISEAIQLAGCPVVYSSDLPKDLLNASLFLYITRAEGLGSAALLSLAMGIPVIASDIGGLTEALAHGQAGILVPNNPPKIAAAITELRENSTLAQTLIDRGKQHVAEFFTAQRMVDDTLAVYRRVLAR